MPFQRTNGKSSTPDPGYNTKIGDDGVKPTGTGNSGGLKYDSGVYSRSDLDTNCHIDCGYGMVTGKGKKD